MKCIDKKKLVAKSVEDAIKKAIELSLVAAVLGLAAQYVMVVTGAVMVGSMAAKAIKVQLLD